MTGSKKKLVEVGIIVVGSLFLAFKLLQSYVVKKDAGNEVKIDLPISFNLEEAKKALANIGGLKEKTAGIEKRLRDILKRPDELTSLEHSFRYGDIPEKFEGAQEEKLTLEGIMFVGEKGNLAIISGKVVSEGDMIGSGKVLKIGPDRVILLKNGSQIELKR